MSETKSGSLTHIAFIMDGNGRWAQKRGLARVQGHSAGVKTLRNVLKHCKKRGIDTVTVYAFSTENWKRPQKEVDGIMQLVDAYIAECEKNANEYDVRIRFLGDKTPFSPARREAMEHLEKITAHKTRVLNIALNYGGRDEIVRACNRLLASGATSVDEKTFSTMLDTAPVCDPDLVVRTGGDLRLSNFLMWQSAYAELYFTDVLWPDFDAEALDLAIEEFYKRKRRFGGV